MEECDVDNKTIDNNGFFFFKTLTLRLKYEKNLLVLAKRSSYLWISLSCVPSHYKVITCLEFMLTRKVLLTTTTKELSSRNLLQFKQFHIISNQFS